MTDTDKYERARKKVEELKGFYIHLIVYVLVNIGIFILNMVTMPHNIWFIYPLFGWGFGLLMHFLSITFKGRGDGEWEARKIKEYMEKDHRKD